MRSLNYNISNVEIKSLETKLQTLKKEINSKPWAVQHKQVCVRNCCKCFVSQITKSQFYKSSIDYDTLKTEYKNISDIYTFQNRLYMISDNDILQITNSKKLTYEVYDSVPLN